MTPQEIRQERNFGEKINATFEFSKQHFKPLLVVFIAIVVPFSLLAGIFSGMFQSEFMEQIQEMSKEMNANSDSQNMFQNLMILYKKMGVALLSNPMYILATTFSVISKVLLVICVFVYMNLSQTKQANEITPAIVMERIKNQFGQVLWLTILTAVLTLLGFVLFIAPGIYVAVALSLALPIMINEQTDASTTIHRSFQLIKGKWFSTLGLLIIVGIVAGIMGMVFAIPLSVMSGLGGKQSSSGLTISIIMAITTACTTILFSLVYIALGFQYYNLVERQKNTYFPEDSTPI